MTTRSTDTNTIVPHRIRFLAWGLKVLYAPVVRQAAREALEGRPVQRGIPEKGRWLKRDVRMFVRGVWPEVSRLLPEAQLHLLPTLGNQHNVFLAVVTTAAYRELLKTGMDHGYAMELIADVGWKIYSRMLALVGSPFRLLTRNRQRRMDLTLRALLVFPFSAPGAPGYEVRAWASDDGFRTHWTHCPPHSFARRLSEKHGTDELEAFYRSWCLYDWAAADQLADDGRHGHYSRPRTLSRGDSVCDMCWYAGTKPSPPQAKRTRIHGQAPEEQVGDSPGG